MSEAPVPPAPPRIESVRALEAFVLEVRWRGGRQDRIDVGPFLRKFRVFAPLLSDPALFSRVQPGEYNADIMWTEELDMSSDTLQRLAAEQAETRQALAS